MRTDVGQGVVVFRGVHDFAKVTEIKPELGVIGKHTEELGGVIEALTAAGVSQD